MVFQVSAHQESFAAESLKEKMENLRIVVWNKIYNRKKLLENNLFFREGFRFEDVYWTPLVMEKLGKAIWVTNVFYHYRWNLLSITKAEDDVQKQNENLAASTYYHYFLYSRKIKTPYVDIKEQKYAFREKRKYRVLGIKCLTVLIGQKGVKVYLFGIPVWSCEKKTILRS